MPVSRMAARAGAMRRAQAVSWLGLRAKKTITASDVSAYSSSRPNPPVVPRSKNRSCMGGAPASAYPAMTASAVTLWARDAVLGMLLLPVRLSTPGSTPSRPKANAYLQHAVMEGEHGGEQAGQEQPLGGLAQRAAAQGEQQARSLRGGGGGHVAGAGVGGHGPGRSGVDDADQGEGEVGGDRDGAAWVACFFAQHGGLLEPGEAEHGDHGQHPEGAEPGRGQRGRRQGREAQVPARGVRQARDGLGHDDDDLGAGQHAQDLAGDVDPRPGPAR